MFDGAWVVEVIGQAMAGSPGHHKRPTVCAPERGKRARDELRWPEGTPAFTSVGRRRTFG